jgi:glycosyltransferase involved in cell wall biosynthesis
MYSNHPQVSVVVPAYNAERTIECCIASVLRQTFTDIELIVCDDASVDSTLQRLRGFEDPRLTVLNNEVNLGEGMTRDRAIAVARGRWLAVLDADDAWQPNRLQLMLEVVGEQEDCMVFDDLLLCHDAAYGMIPWKRLRGQRAFGARRSRPRDVAAEDYIRSERLLIKPLIPRRAILEHHLRHSDRRFAADTEYFLRLASLGLRFRYLPEPLYWYRITPGSATAAAKGGAQMRECLMECANYPGFSPAARRAFSYKIRQLEDYEALHDLVHQLRQLQLLRFAAEASRRPRAILIVPRLLTRRLLYVAHRAWHGGRRHLATARAIPEE